ncbi:hypothetical protein [Streptomyces sp. NPDC051211]|uniref:hypothetical protein n=1 Tax=Streptomyces sp. NPDC051211 TaxID=3154643 RepID=UPI0034503A64
MRSLAAAGAAGPGADPVPGAAANRSTRRRVMDGARRASPVLTRRMAAARWSEVTSLRRNPLAPAARAA